MKFTHLHVHSYFSLLDGAAPPNELCECARQMGMRAVAVTDHNTLAGAVRFYQAAQNAGIKPIIGVEFTVELALDHLLLELHPPGRVRQAIGRSEAPSKTTTRPDTTVDYTRYAHLVLIAQDNEGYSNLCRLVTCARLGKAQYSGPFSDEFAQIDRKKPVLSQEHLRQHSSHLICLSGCAKGEIPRRVSAGQLRLACRVADYYRQIFADNSFYIEVQNNLLPPPENQLRYRLENLADRMQLPVVATNNVHYVDRAMAKAQDILVCMRTLQTVDEYHPDRKTNAEYGLKAPHEMAALFPDRQDALRNTLEIAERCDWKLDLETLHFPQFDLETLGHVDRDATFIDAQQQPCRGASPGTSALGKAHGAPDEHTAGQAQWPLPEPGETTSDYLRRLCYFRAQQLYVHLDDCVRGRIEHELRVINEQGLCDYFLIVWDICRFSRSRGILTTGRGSAGDSIISYLLNITSVDPLQHDLLFERFLNPCRRTMPDIDVDFDSRRRDEVTAYIYRRYGAERVAAVCTINTFRARSAVRDVGKALGLEEDEIGAIAEILPHVRASEIAQAAEHMPEVRDADIDLSDKSLLLDLCRQISGFPRHLSVHVGGLVIGAQPLTNMVSLALANKGIVINEFDKDDVEALGLVKMDILGLRIHTAVSDCLDLVQRRTGKSIDLDRIPLDDDRAFELLRSTHTLGLFQLESPGQRNLLGRAQPKQFEEVIANISLFRPGPVQSDMITPYLRRKHGLEPVTYLHPNLEPIMRRTYGVLIYQEQVLEIAAAVAGFTLGEADQLRRLMTSNRSREEMLRLGDSFIEKATQRGVDRQAAEGIFHMVSGFAAYGFCKAHAACFGKISYQTAWLKAYYPAEFLAGILSAQPMGFYPPRTIAEEAKRLGCRILPPCVNRSDDRFTVENGDIRVGLRLLRGMSESAMRSILNARAQDGPFASLREFCERTCVPRPVTENLILVRAFEFTQRSEQELLWLLAALPRELGRDVTGRASTALASACAEKHPEAAKGSPSTPRFAFETAADILDSLPDFGPTTAVGRVALDLNITHVSTTVNPFYFWRERMRQMDVMPSTRLYECKDGDTVRVAGVVIARARPPTRSGKIAIFVSLEDEYGLVDVAVFEQCYQRCGRALYSSPVLCIEGRLTRQGKLDLSITARDVIGLGSWRDFDRMNRPRGGQRTRINAKLMERWEPGPNAKVGERRG